MSILSNIAVSALSGAAAAGVVVLAGSVSLQGSTPGTADVGHSNISGYSLAGRFGANTSPTLARVQVNETGSLQGVRSVTDDGVSVFGKSTATTGLGAGGYFTTSSVGGRGIVGDALSGTGSTVGGLFYNRSSGTGAGVWGRAIGGGAGYGVLGETTSATGFGLAAENDATGYGMFGGAPDTSLKTFGAIPKHVYGPGSASAAMVPIAYGNLGSDGVPVSGSGNFTVTHPSAGRYDVDVTGVSFDEVQSIPMVTVVQETGNEVATIGTSPASGDFRIVVYSIPGAVLTNSQVMFVVYRAAGMAGPPMPNRIANPPAAKKFSDKEEWQKKDPKSFAEWRTEYAAWEKKQLQSGTAVFPTDGSGRP